MERTKVILTFIVASALALAGTTAKAGKLDAIKGFEIGIEGGVGYLGTLDHTLFNVPGYYEDEFSVNIYDIYNERYDVGAFVWGAHIGYNLEVFPSAVLGFEVGYKDLGESSYDSNYQHHYASNSRIDNVNISIHRGIEQQAVDLLLTGRYFLWQKLNILGKAGVAYVRSETDQQALSTEITQLRIGPVWHEYVETNPYNYDNTIWRLRPEIALGVSYIFNQHFDVHVVWNHIFAFDSDQDTNSDPTASTTVNPSEPIGSVSPTIPQYPSAYIYSSNSVMLGISWIF